MFEPNKMDIQIFYHKNMVIIIIVQDGLVSEVQICAKCVSQPNENEIAAKKMFPQFNPAFRFIFKVCDCCNCNTQTLFGRQSTSRSPFYLATAKSSQIDFHFDIAK